MSKEIKKYDDRGNLIYYKCLDGLESWHKYDDENREIYCKRSDGYEFQKEYNKKSNLVYYKSNQLGNEEIWYKIDEYGEEIRITKKRFEEIEYLSRKKFTRFELMDI